MYAFRWVSLRCASSITGTDGEPELAGRQHPAVAGDDAVLAVDQDREVQPYSRIEPAISATCASLWVRAFRA